MRIVTLTPNPAIDKSTRVKQLVPEQKLRCETPEYAPGGGGINVSRGLKRLGTSSTAIFPVGGRPGLLLKDLLKMEHIDYKAVDTKNETRENFTVVDISGNQQYRFGMPGPELLKKEAGQFAKLIKDLSPDLLIMSGSLPPGLDTDFFAEITQTARKWSASVIVDTSGEALQTTVDKGVYMIKPNLGELSKLVGAETLDNETMIEAAQELIQKGKCQVIVVSMGPRGAYLFAKDTVEHVPSPTVKKRSTVGAGDSMVAGMVHQLARKKSLPEMVRMGVSCGTAATMNPGTELFKKTDAQNLYSWLIKRR